MINFNYRLVGIGWCRATLSDNRQQIDLVASYLSDALGDLVHAVVQLLEGATDASCNWEQEPGTTCWLLSRHGDDLQITITQTDLNPHLWSGSVDSRTFEVVFESYCALRQFSLQLVDQLKELLATVGVDGYVERWLDAPFPMEGYERLMHLLQNE